MAEPSNNDSGQDTDHAFEPTAEMLVHDYDDEATIEEQEALSNDSCSSELNALQEEADMPIEALLAMYYGGGSQQQEPQSGQADSTSTSSSSSFSSHSRRRGEDDILSNQDLTLDKEEIARDVLRDDDGSETSVDELLESVQSSSQTACLLGRMHADGYVSNDIDDSGDEDSDEDMEYLPFVDEDSWKKTIQIGSGFQAEIPEWIPVDVQASKPACTDEEDSLLWDPSLLAEHYVATYLQEVVPSITRMPLQTKTSACSDTVLQNPSDAAVHCNLCIRDNEQALNTLVQCCYNVKEALCRMAAEPVLDTDPLMTWSEEDCQNFEAGLQLHGKNFTMIQKSKVTSKAVSELVNFYYYWKKTERRNLLPRIYSEKKHAGFPSYSRDPIDGHHVDSAGSSRHLAYHPELADDVTLPVDKGLESASAPCSDTCSIALIESSHGLPALSAAQANHSLPNAEGPTLCAPPATWNHLSPITLFPSADITKLSHKDQLQP